MFDKSPNTKKILAYAEKKYNRKIAEVLLIKSASVVSGLFKEYPRMNVINVAPSGTFKSQTDRELSNIFSQKYLLSVGSDFTIHSLYEQHYKKNPKVFMNKCVIINDMTLLMFSKADHTLTRLIHGLAELLTEGIYIYSERKEHLEIKGKFSSIVNVTKEAYQSHRKRIINSTWGERYASIFLNLDELDMEVLLKSKREKMKLIFDDKKFDKLKDYQMDTDLYSYRDRIYDFCIDFSMRNDKGLARMHDHIEAMLKAHACLNERKNLEEDDFEFVELVAPYLIDNIFEERYDIYRLARRGMKPVEIAEVIGFTTDAQLQLIYKSINRARIRGVLPPKKRLIPNPDAFRPSEEFKTIIEERIE